MHNNNKSKLWAVLHKTVSWAKNLDIFIFTGQCKEPCRESFCRWRWCAGRESVGIPDIAFCENHGSVTHIGVMLRLRVPEIILSIKAQVTEFVVSRNQCLLFTTPNPTSELKILGFFFFLAFLLGTWTLKGSRIQLISCSAREEPVVNRALNLPSVFCISILFWRFGPVVLKVSQNNDQHLMFYSKDWFFWPELMFALIWG